MYRSILLTLGLLLICTSGLKAQDSLKINHIKVDHFALGFGLGQEYGGYGVNLALFPFHHVGLFVALGKEPLVDFGGANAGIKIRSLPQNANTKLCANILLMYGTNGILVAQNNNYSSSTNNSRAYFGPTLGIGFDWRNNPTESKSYWSFTVLIPFRDSSFPESDAYPFSLSLGYHFGL